MLSLFKSKPPRAPLIPPTFEKAAPPQPPPQALPLNGSSGDYWGSLSDGFYLSPEAIENLSAVVACVSAIAGAIVSLPATVYRYDANAKRMVEAPEHPLSSMILSGVNERESWADFIEMLMGNVLMRGNGLAKIDMGANGRLVGLSSIPWALAAPLVTHEGKLFFNAVMPYTGLRETLLNDEVIHLKGRSDDTYFGEAPHCARQGCRQRCDERPDQQPAILRQCSSPRRCADCARPHL